MILAHPRRALVAVCLAAMAAAAGRAQEPPILAKARAYLGSEAALDGITSVHLVGTLTISDSTANGGAPRSIGVDIVFQKPWRHRLVIRSGRVVRTVALDGYDAWERYEDPSDPKTPRLTLYGPDAIRALRADVWENLGYYRGLEACGGSVEDQGPATIEGVACEKVAFVHSPDIVYTRYFDRSSGRLVYTETANHSQVREVGAEWVRGIRFAKQIVTVQKLPSGGAKTTTLTFDSITVNERFPDSDFAMPFPPARRAAQPSAPLQAPVPVPAGGPKAAAGAPAS